MLEFRLFLHKLKIFNNPLSLIIYTRNTQTCILYNSDRNIGYFCTNNYCNTIKRERVRAKEAYRFVFFSILGLSCPTQVHQATSMKSLPGFLNLEMGPIGCPETSIRNYHYMLGDSPEVRRSHHEYCSLNLIVRGGVHKTI